MTFHFVVYKINVFVSMSYVPFYFIHALNNTVQMYFSLVFETFKSKALHSVLLTVQQKDPTSSFVLEHGVGSSRPVNHDIQLQLDDLLMRFLITL